MLEQFIPFDPVSKRTEARLITASGERFQVSKGAPQVILSLVGHDPALTAEVEAVSHSFADRGFRALGVARTDAGGSGSITPSTALPKQSVFCCSPHSRWNMPVVLGAASVLGVLGVAESFGLFYLAQRILELNRDMVQTLLYLKLSVAGHLTVFAVRTRGPFWKSRPAPILTTAVVSTQVLATLLAVYGLFMVPLGWTWALVVWGYSLICFVLNDRIKILAYQLFDPRKLLLSLRGHPGL